MDTLVVSLQGKSSSTACTVGPSVRDWDLQLSVVFQLVSDYHTWGGEPRPGYCEIHQFSMNVSESPGWALTSLNRLRWARITGGCIKYKTGTSSISIS